MNKAHNLAALIAAMITVCSCHLPGVKQAPVQIVNHGVRIAYTDTGKGDTTLLLVHGWCLNRSYWSSQIAYFGKKYRVVAIDLPGFGQSGKNRQEWNTAAFASDVNAVITQLKLKNVILVGHSMAGDIVLQAAVNQPDKVIALVGVDNFKSVGIGAPPTEKEKQAYAKAIDSLRHHFKFIAFDYFNHQLFYKTTSMAIRKRILNDVAHSDSIIASACMEETDFPESAKLIDVRKKLYLINSDVDSTKTTGLKTRHIPFELHYIHATGHFPMVEKPEEFNSALAQVIRHVGVQKE